MCFEFPWKKTTSIIIFWALNFVMMEPFLSLPKRKISAVYKNLYLDLYKEKGYRNYYDAWRFLFENGWQILTVRFRLWIRIQILAVFGLVEWNVTELYCVVSSSTAEIPEMFFKRILRKS